MIVVSDTSPLSSLFLIEKLELLPLLFGKIIVPQKVMEEILVLETGFGHDLSELKSASWLEVQDVKNKQKIVRLQQFLDAGESEAIVLAKEFNADYILIDDKKGRNAASAEGLKTIGVLGVFLLAKQKGLANAIRPLMDDLQLRAKFYIREELYQQVLIKAGE